MSIIKKILEKRMTQKDVKQGIGIANDKRYAGGNMTGATKAMDKLKPGLSDHPAVQKALRKANEETELDEAVTVKKDNYSWGKMVTVHHGSENSYPLHPEHQAAIKKLKDGEHTTFTDETKRKVTAKREGDKVHLSGAGSNKKTTISHSHFNEETEKDTADYKVDKRGRKHKAHKIVFNKGEEEMKEEKKTYKTFIEQHTLPLTEEQLDEIVSELQEVLGKDAKAGDWISDFVKSDNPKFEGKSKEKRKEMALAAYYAKQRNEEVDEAVAAKTDDKFLAYLAQRKAEKDKKKEGEMKEELKGNQHKLDKNKNGKLDKHDFKLLRKEDAEQMDEAESHQAKTTMKHISNPTAGEKKASKDIKPGIKGFSDRIAMLKSAQARGALKKEEAESVDEGLWPGTPEYKKKFDTDRVTGAGARHDIKKTSTGVIATRRFADNDTAEKAKDEPKRGRGRPKKDKFAEAVEFLIALDEETFDSLMEEGFDSFMEQFEQLDEISKATLGSYVKKASRDAVVKRKIGADFENMADKSRKPSSKSAATELADKWKAKSWKRSANINKAVDRLTK